MFSISPSLYVPLKCSSSAEKKIGVVLPGTFLKHRQSPASSHASVSPPSSRIMPPPPPPPPPKFSSSTPSSTSSTMLPPKSASSFSVNGVSKDNISNMSNFTSVPETLVKLMEYGDDDDETDEDEHDDTTANPDQIAVVKPFWAA